MINSARLNWREPIIVVSGGGLFLFAGFQPGLFADSVATR
jgi:hypothetical protein